MRGGEIVDREKVIADIEEQITWIRDNDFHKFPGWGHAVLAMQDALVLLKEQEPTMVIESENMYTGLPITHCPKCGRSLDRYLYGRRQEGEINFCPYCGRGVKWNE